MLSERLRAKVADILLFAADTVRSASCGTSCPNLTTGNVWQVARERRVTSNIELRQTPAKGEGVFATGPFKAGETVMVGVIEKKLSKNHSHASQVGEHEFAFHAGLISKFNHSCDPNCGIRLNADGGHDFVAIRSIERNEETTFDYAMRNYRIDHFPGSCQCREPACRGSITGWRDLPQLRKDQYAGFVAPYLIKMDERARILSRLRNTEPANVRNT
jgi:hypothetical protein